MPIEVMPTWTTDENWVGLLGRLQRGLGTRVTRLGHGLQTHFAAAR